MSYSHLWRCQAQERCDLANSDETAVCSPPLGLQPTLLPLIWAAHCSAHSLACVVFLVSSACLQHY